MIRPFHSWTQVYVSQSKACVPSHHELLYSYQCGRCGLLRHKVAPPHTAANAITYELTGSPVGTWRWHYPDGRRWCSKPKDWLGRAA